MTRLLTHTSGLMSEGKRGEGGVRAIERDRVTTTRQHQLEFCGESLNPFLFV